MLKADYLNWSSEVNSSVLTVERTAETPGEYKNFNETQGKYIKFDIYDCNYDRCSFTEFEVKTRELE